MPVGGDLCAQALQARPPVGVRSQLPPKTVKSGAGAATPGSTAPPVLGQMDPSLFVTPSSTLKKVDRDPVGSPLKRTKVSEEDAAIRQLHTPGYARPISATASTNRLMLKAISIPAMVPQGRPRIPGPAGEMLMSTVKKGALSAVKKSSQEMKKQSANATPIVTRGSDSVISPTDPAQDVDFYHGPWLSMLEHLELPPFTPIEGKAFRLRCSIESVIDGGYVQVGATRCKRLSLIF